MVGDDAAVPSGGLVFAFIAFVLPLCTFASPNLPSLFFQFRLGSYVLPLCIAECSHNWLRSIVVEELV
jgi:hypothetical protein